mgnify:CR=1 FL=1
MMITPLKRDYKRNGKENKRVVEKTLGNTEKHWEKWVDRRKREITVEGEGSVREKRGRRIQLGLSR